jgi:hypothetical protein
MYGNGFSELKEFRGLVRYLMVDLDFGEPIPTVEPTDNRAIRENFLMLMPTSA